MWDRWWKKTFWASEEQIASRFNQVASRIDLLERSSQLALAELQNVHISFASLQRRLDDLSLSLDSPWDNPFIIVETDFPVAFRSADHTHPRGTANDNTRHPRFVLASEKIFAGKISALDIGCSGGGLVFDFLQQGHLAVGIEGSDYSQKMLRAYWSLLPKHLFTCDASKPFRVIRSDATMRFDLITAWEFLEHIPAEALAVLFTNIRDHLKDDGLFVASVATFADCDPETGAVWHVTIRDRDWWNERLRENGLEVVDSPYEFQDYPRGSGNPLAIGDWNAAKNPELGFHIAARRK